MKHNELILEFCRQQDLSKWMLWTEPTLGANTDVCAKPDVLMISKSWANYEVRIIEVKVNQSDLNQDVKKLKFEKYNNWCHRVSFCLDAGLKEDILKDHPVGIIKLTKGGFHTKKAAPRLQNRTADFTQSFDMFHALNMGGNRFDTQLRVDRVRQAREWLELAAHKGEFNRMFANTSKKFRDEMRALERAREKPIDIENTMRREFNDQIKKVLTLNSWRSPDEVGKFVAEIFNTCRDEFDKNLETRFKALLVQTGFVKEAE